jgi:AcrR family transcriptional regulator
MADAARAEARPAGTGRALRADAARNREKVLRAARDAFAESGYGVPLDEIAARAGVGPGTVYRHFPTKEALFEAVVTARLEDLVADARCRADSSDPGASFFGFLARIAEEASAKRDLPDAISIPGSLRDDLDTALDVLLRAAQHAGAVRAEVRTADLILLLKGMFAALADVSEPTVREVVFAVLADGLRPPGHRERGLPFRMQERSAHGEHTAGVASSDGVWLAATWPFIRGQLPPPPARVIELGCGPGGGHVPALLRAGYDATGVDPGAPEGPAYRRVAFEEYRPEDPADAVVASVSLHHVDDPGAVLDHVAEVLRPDGVIVVVEWISEDFDEPTARWCLRHQLRDEAGAWLGELSAEWTASGLSWDAFFQAWLAEHGLHPASVIRPALEARFATTHLGSGPYYFPDMPDTDAAAEQAAIDAGHIRAGCLRYAGRVRPAAAGT